MSAFPHLVARRPLALCTHSSTRTQMPSTTSLRDPTPLERTLHLVGRPPRAGMPQQVLELQTSLSSRLSSRRPAVPLLWLSEVRQGTVSQAYHYHTAQRQGASLACCIF